MYRDSAMYNTGGVHLIKGFIGSVMFFGFKHCGSLCHNIFQEE